MITNALGLFTCGTMFDKGVRAIWINLIVTVVGMGVGVGVYRGVWTSASATAVNTIACWFLMPLFQYIVGVAMASVALPATRVYAPLERTTGFRCDSGACAWPACVGYCVRCSCALCGALSSPLRIPPLPACPAVCSFGYNCGYGIIGGLTPFAVSAIIESIGKADKAFAPSFWLLAMGGATLLGCGMMRAYAPRINRPFIGKVE